MICMSNHQHQGGCHCGAVRYQITLNTALKNQRILSCNCSMCEKYAFLHLIVKRSRFQLLTDQQNLSRYQFNQNIAKHYFCRYCGVKSFYQPRSHPNDWSVNVRCLDDFADQTFNIEPFDGKNWEKNINHIQ